MAVTKEYFGTTKSQEIVDRYILSNKDGLSVHLLTYGATIQKLFVSNQDGREQDVVLGFDALTSYEGDHPYVGCIIGRNANRLQETILIDGASHTLPTNEGSKQLHGGRNGFHRRVWEATIEGETVMMKYRSKDGEEGFPGTLMVQASFRLVGKQLIMRMEATTDAATIVNLTRHDYFNLNQVAYKNILGHSLVMNASKYTPLDSEMLPTGAIVPVENTPYDFSKGKLMGSYVNGFDLNYVLNKEEGALDIAAQAWSPDRDLKMNIYCTQPGIQFYTAKQAPLMEGKYSKTSPESPGFCLEPQCFPNSPAHTNFPSTLLKRGEVYEEQIVYGFEYS